MTRRKRAITASINNLKRAKQLKEDHTQKPVEPEDAVSDIPVPIGDIRIFTVVISAYAGKGSAGASLFSQFSIHCVLSWGPSLGEYFPPRVGRWTTVKADAVGTYTVKGHASLCVMVSYFNNA